MSSGGLPSHTHHRPYQYPPVPLLQLGGGLVHHAGELLPLQQVVVVAQDLQVLQIVLRVEQRVLRGLQLPAQAVAAGAGVAQQRAQDSRLVAVLGGDLGAG